jgi:hypothetical protein
MRACQFCGTQVPHQLVPDSPGAVVARAEQLGLSVEQHAAQNLPHVCFDIVLFDSHTGPCGRRCAGSLLPAQRNPGGCSVHNGVACPCVRDCDCGA